ncbi:MAG TPA: oligosaccharide flippase family protein [Thermoleophilaceae bacterium]|nr:oligosaccharide flippase family protein [Thermoleophilaceae bacterium]
MDESTNEALRRDEVRDRAVGGAAVLGARGAVTFAIGIVANLALARLLVPRDFGVVALGSVLLIVGTYLMDGGLGAALIRRTEPPERAELEAVEGLQLAAATALAAIAAGAALLFGRDGAVIALMLASLPITTARLPAAIVLERQLLYRPVAFVDLVEALSYYAWALAAVALGFGVWGLASAVVARAILGVLTMARVGPVGFVRPRWSWPTVRPMIAFGAKLQATAVVAIGRDQGLNVGVAALAGIPALGVWSLAYRILQVPTLIVTTATRVSFPAMARILEAGEDPRPPIERAVTTVAVVIGVVGVGLVGLAPALPALLGDGWADVPEALLWSAAGLVLSAPVIVGTIGYLYATDNAGTVVWGVVWQALVWFAVTLPLLPSLGAPAVGIGSVPAGVAIAAIVGRRAAAMSGAAVVRSLARPLALSAAGGAAGWALASHGSETLPWGLVGALVAEVVLLGGLWLVGRSLLADTYAIVARAVRRSVA